MSNTLLKIYSFFIVTVILFSSILLYTKKVDLIQTPKDSLRKKVSKDSGVILPVSETIPTISTTSNNKILSSQKIIETKELVKTPELVPVAQLTEIDTNEIDTRAVSQKPKPCVTPITYTLGTFDPRFSISRNYFLETISEAVTLWNNATGKKLLEYTSQPDTNTLTINLIYDSRQQNTDNNKLLGVEIDNTRNAALLLKDEYEALKVIFSQSKDEYIQKVDTFNARQKVYNDTVIYWNEKGGAPQQEFNNLTTEKELLQKESESLTSTHNSLTTTLADINTKINKYNELVAFANERVNINNSTAKKKFTEGNYSPSTNSITIYQFTDDIKLKRVVAHEIGHAVGVDHTKSKESIMYSVNSATSTILNWEDVEAIKDICNNN